ncbi:MAG: hypothetical protein JO352_02125 [Chloroflexi bacterium]|nr:hypothetical protein [Chloroflexota bacterium]
MSRASSTSSVPPRPAFWARLSETVGIAIQAAGLLLGIGLVYAAAHVVLDKGAQLATVLLGWFLVYVCCHASAHWAVGRAVGIRFRGFGLRGSDHPQDYPPGVRQLMQVLPTFTALTDQQSVRQASPVGRAAMYAAGETSTAICSVLIGWYAWASGIPGGSVLLTAMVVFNVFATIVTAIVPRGDYAKARRALRSPAAGQ